MGRGDVFFPYIRGKGFNGGMTMKRKRLLMVYPSFSSFVRGDWEVLSGAYEVTRYEYDFRGNQARALWRQAGWLLVHGWRFGTVYVWFADWHALLPTVVGRLLGRRVYVVAGGYDVARDEVLGYGSFSRPLRGWVARQVMRWATRVLCVSRDVERRVRAVAGRGNAVLLYNGTGMRAGRVEAGDKEAMVLTVAAVETERQSLVKGLDRFVAVARELPGYRFVMVGVGGEVPALMWPLPGNVEVVGRVEWEEMAGYYRRAKVYCQLSRWESFCLALTEGMAWGCVPVVTDAGGMPEVVGGTGAVVGRRHLEDLPAVVRRAMEGPFSLAGRERVERCFSLERRGRELLALLEGDERRRGRG